MNKNVNFPTIVGFRKAVSILVLFLTLAGTHLFIFAQNISLKYQITDLKIKLNELTSQTKALGSQASRGEDLAVVERIAKTKLDMVYPEDITYITTSAPGKRNPTAAAASREPN
ncbi:MAG: septum formation initiator family protein [Candidatus Margulisbacteria bacterium]|nr:septum formation initiator family protein [Candidatus Margulisiibacteriota bacterium]